MMTVKSDRTIYTAVLIIITLFSLYLIECCYLIIDVDFDIGM